MFRIVAARRAKAKKRVPERTRDALIAAAGELFVEQGLDGASLDAICERAGYTRGAFYVHFASRDELVGAVVETAMRQFLDAIVGEGEPELAAIIDAFVRALGEGRFPISARVRASQVLEACARSWELRVKYLAVLVSARERIASAVRRGQAAGTVREDLRADAIAEMLLAMVIGVQIATQLEAPYDARAVAKELGAMLAPSSAPRAPRTTGASKKRAVPRPPAKTQRRKP
jgi:TetR/AcrR family transcriptional repressor of nem operon